MANDGDNKANAIKINCEIKIILFMDFEFSIPNWNKFNTLLLFIIPFS